MNTKVLSLQRVRQILNSARKTRVLVVGDVMLDQFIWGSVARISPEAPVPVVDFERESFMPGGAANVARNLRALDVATDIFAAVGQDAAASELQALLKEQKVGCRGLLVDKSRPTSVKARVVAHKQQVVRIDREARD
jgi:D-beta-D-heptose 7-phosphate kinase/D-beta-D-heptose 1-phosphate adenosyltransferase